MSELILMDACVTVGDAVNTTAKVILPNLEVDVIAAYNRNDTFYDPPSDYRLRPRNYNVLDDIDNKITVFPSYNFSFLKKTMGLENSILSCEILTKEYIVTGNFLLVQNCGILKSEEALSAMYFEAITLIMSKKGKQLYSIDWENRSID